MKLNDQIYINRINKSIYSIYYSITIK